MFSQGAFDIVRQSYDDLQNISDQQCEEIDRLHEEIQYFCHIFVVNVVCCTCVNIREFGKS